LLFIYTYIYANIACNSYNKNNHEESVINVGNCMFDLMLKTSELYRNNVRKVYHVFHIISSQYMIIILLYIIIIFLITFSFALL